MDPLTGDNPVHPDPGAVAAYEQARLAMMYTLRLARQIDLAKMEPRPDLSSTAYALADPGERQSGLPTGQRAVQRRPTGGERVVRRPMAGPGDRRMGRRGRSWAVGDGCTSTHRPRAMRFCR